jgi:ribonuclease HI
MDRTDRDCPPQSFKNVVEYAKKNGLALVAGTDANAHNTYWNSKTFDKVGTDRGDSLLAYIASENLMIENNGDMPTFDNGRWQNVIDLTITNKKGHDLLSKWQVEAKDEDKNSSDHHFITYKITPSNGIGKTKFRDIAKTDWKKFQEVLAKNMENSSDILNDLESEDKIDEAAERLADNVTRAFNSACVETYVSNKIRSPPWETAEVREANAGIKHRLRRARGTKSDKDWSELRSHQAEYNRLVGRTKTKKFKEFCKNMEAKSSSKRISAIIKNNKTTRLGTVRKPDGSLTESPEDTIDIMTKTHFERGISGDEPSKNRQTAENSPTVPNNDWDIDSIFSERRVEKSLMEFDGLKAAGPDGIRPIMLQKGLPLISRAYADIAKASFKSGHVPACWRKSSGIFLPKPGKTDYYNPKSYRTITLAPVPLKWMERVVLWHMEVDLKIYSKLSKKQYGFVKGSSTETALHKIVHKIERTIINSGMALGTFLDVEGAFDNVAFSAIERALNQKCESATVNNWIMSLIRNRTTTVELNGCSKIIKITKGCPQGGILSPFLWNLVVDSLLSFTRNRIPCDLQGFADDLALLAITEAPNRSGIQGFDADTLREMTQKSLDSINDWCNENGLTLSTLKTHSVMFTWRRNWKFSRPLTVNNVEIELKNSTKFLGVTLDSKLLWNNHIEKQCKKAKGILMQCRRAIGPTWGFTPKTMKWIYTAVVRPTLTYAATIWLNGLYKKSNLALLKSVQRLANILITGALPSTSGAALNIIAGTIPIDLMIEEEAAKGALRLMANNHWINEPMLNQKGHLTTHTKRNKTLLQYIPLHNEEQDQQASTLNVDTNFRTEIPVFEDYQEVSEEDTIQCYTDGSMMNSQVGAGIFVVDKQTPPREESYHLGPNSTVFQAETFAVGKAAEILLEAGTVNRDIVINCDSQATIMAVNRCTIKSKTTSHTLHKLNQLGENNNVLLRWIPAHKGYAGNEKADSLAKLGSANSDSSVARLPIPKVIWKGALRERSHRKMRDRWRELPSSHFKRVWRDKFTKSISKFGKESLRSATQFLTGHCELNYHINKYKPNDTPKTCPHCLTAEETMNHFIGQCPKWSYQRGGHFNSYYLSITEVVDKFSLSRIVGYINSTRRFNNHHGVGN